MGCVIMQWSRLVPGSTIRKFDVGLPVGEFFSDENDVVYHDDDYKRANAAYYRSEMRKDLEGCNFIYSILEHHFDIDGRTPEETARVLIETFYLKERIR